MEENNKPPVKPLFDNPPANRSQPIQDDIIPDKLPEKPLKTIKDIPYSTRSSRITTALLKLNDKQRTIVKAKSQGKEDKEALKLAGYSDNYIRTDGKKLIQKPAIQSTLQIIMENVGITDEFLATKLKEGMESKKTIGIGENSEEVKDMPTRHKYLETGLKLKGHLDKKVDIVHHKSHEDQLRELQGGEIVDADYEEILPD